MKPFSCFALDITRAVVVADYRLVRAASERVDQPNPSRNSASRDAQRRIREEVVPARERVEAQLAEESAQFLHLG